MIVLTTLDELSKPQRHKHSAARFWWLDDLTKRTAAHAGPQADGEVVNLLSWDNQIPRISKYYQVIPSYLGFLFHVISLESISYHISLADSTANFDSGSGQLLFFCRCGGGERVPWMQWPCWGEGPFSSDFYLHISGSFCICHMFPSCNSWQIIRHLSMVIHHDPVASGIWLDHIGSLSVRLTEHG